MKESKKDVQKKDVHLSALRAAASVAGFGRRSWGRIAAGVLVAGSVWACQSSPGVIEDLLVPSASHSPLSTPQTPKKEDTTPSSKSSVQPDEQVAANCMGAQGKVDGPCCINELGRWDESRPGCEGCSADENLWECCESTPISVDCSAAGIPADCTATAERAWMMTCTPWGPPAPPQWSGEKLLHA